MDLLDRMIGEAESANGNAKSAKTFDDVMGFESKK